jgi:hypothetical protein
LAGVHNFIICDVVLQVLHDLDALVEVVLRVAVDELTDELAFVGALPHYLTVVLEKMIQKEFVEVLVRRHRVLIDLSRKSLAEEQGVYETARDRLQFAEEHQ